jgi:hypothetical protein
VVVNLDDWGGKNPPVIEPRRRAAGTVIGVFPEAANVVQVQTDEGETLGVRTDLRQ